MGAEKNYENKIKDYLRSLGCYYVKYHGNAYSTNGTPDILACVNGYFVGIEVKAQNGRYDPEGLQAVKLRDIRNAGGFGYVVFPSGWEKLKGIIDGLMRDEFKRDEEVIIK